MNTTDAPLNGYIALYGSQRHEIRTNAGLYAAKLLALAYFHPPKSKRHLVTVHLAEKAGDTVTQVITS